MKLILVFFALVNITIVLTLLSDWMHLSEIRQKTRRKRELLLSVFCLGIFPLTWGSAVVYQKLEAAQQISFCAQCHVMTEYIESLSVDDDEPLSAVHYQNNWVPQQKACYFCHTNYTMFGPIKSKLNGMKHLYTYYIKGPPKKLKLFQKYKNRDCLRCHGTAKRYNRQKKHRRVKNLLAQLKTEERSCFENGCHEMGHLLASDDW